MAWEAASPWCDTIAIRLKGLPLEAIVTGGYWRVAFFKADSMGLHLCGVVLLEKKHHESSWHTDRIQHAGECFLFCINDVSVNYSENLKHLNDFFVKYFIIDTGGPYTVHDTGNIHDKIWFQTKQAITNWQGMWEEMGPLIGLIMNLALSFASNA